jgi:outer membrane protein, multidrug efflux system
MNANARGPLIAAFLAAILAGCASAPPVEHPDTGIDIPGQWSVPGGIAAADPAWWRLLGDPALEAVITEALEGNRDLRAAAARVDQARALARITGAAQFPAVAAGGSARRQQQNFIGLPIPGAEGQVLSTQIDTFGLSVDTSWEADVWGRIRNGASAALADAEAAQLEQQAARLSLAAQTARTWFALIEAGQQVRLAEDTVASYQRTVQQVQHRYERGLAPSLDLRFALTNLHAAEAQLSQRQEQAGLVMRQLELLLGRYPAAKLDVPHGLPAPAYDIPAGLPADLLAQRPDLLAAERRVAAADARLAADRRALYPSLSLTASGGTTTDAVRRLLDGDFTVWSIAGTLMQPIFQGGRLRAQVDVADAQLREALEAYAGRVLTAFAEVETALDAQGWQRTRVQLLGEAASQAGAALALAEQRYGGGLDPLLVVLEAQRRSLEAESQLLAARRQLLDSRIDLHLALGGSIDDE